MKGYSNYKESDIEWIGRIPSDWSITKLKFISNIFNGNSLNEDLKEKYESDDLKNISYISTKDVEQDTGKINLQNGIRIPTDEGNFKLAVKGSFVLCIEGANAGKKIGYLEEDVYFVNKLACFNYENKFLYYYALSDNFKNQFFNSLSGLIGGVSISIIRNFYSTFPSIEEQTKIASFLDYKTNLIDATIEKKKRLIELLKEKRQAVINEAVTKGLNPNAPMKDSGVEWLGEIPEHWKVARIGHYSQIVRGASPRPAGDPKLFGGDFMHWITVAEVTFGNDKFLYSTKSYLTEEGSIQSRVIYPETLLLSNSGATLGVPKISKIIGCINDGSVAFVSYTKELERDFLYYFFITHTQIYRDEMAGSGQPNLNTDIIKSTKIALPPVSEQIDIINFIENETGLFNNLISKSKELIRKLQAYRQCLISEAVTGKIDVRDWQPTTNK